MSSSVPHIEILPDPITPPVEEPPTAILAQFARSHAWTAFLLLLALIYVVYLYRQCCCPRYLPKGKSQSNKKLD